VILRRRISAASLGVPRRTWCPARPCPLTDLAAMRIAQIEINQAVAAHGQPPGCGGARRACPGPPRCRSGAGRARWQRLTAQFWLLPLELHPRGLPWEFLNIWYPFHAMVLLRLLAVARVRRHPDISLAEKPADDHFAPYSNAKGPGTAPALAIHATPEAAYFLRCVTNQSRAGVEAPSKSFT
jgi:hypothetical protein